MSVDPENLRKLFGQTGDSVVNFFPYADPNTPLGTPPELSGLDLGSVFDVSSLARQSIEKTPQITCDQNRALIDAHLQALISGDQQGRRMTLEENWQVAVHSQQCGHKNCYQPYNLLCALDH